MDKLSQVLASLPEYKELEAAISQRGRTVCVTGLSNIHKAHFISALKIRGGRPLVVLCHDELAVQRLHLDLASFLGFYPSTLPGRELSLRSGVTASKDWEQRRLAALHSFASGLGPGILTVSLESLLMRTMPKSLLLSSLISLKPGQSHKLDTLMERLLLLGYRRSEQVSGCGQFALRGGILDIYSPAHELPVRLEFFGDELDSMGFFDTDTQRRTENAETALVLPVAEVLPGLHEGGIEGLLADIEGLIARLLKRKHINEQLISGLRQDAEELRQNLSFTAADKYMSLIYKNGSSPLSYFPEDTVFILCDHDKLEQRWKSMELQMGQDLDLLLETGVLTGELCDFNLSYDELCDEISGFSAAILDTFPGFSFPTQLEPSSLMNTSVKQLPSYGSSLDTAVSDLEYYLKNQYSIIVFCGIRHKAESFKELLESREIFPVLNPELSRLPAKGEIFIAVGLLSAGIEYPGLKLAIMTEGRTLPPVSKRKPSKTVTNRQKLSSFTDLSPGDFVVHEHHGIGRFTGIEQVELDKITRDYIKIQYSGSDCLLVPATALDLVSKYIGGGEDAPVKLNRLGGDVWAKARARAKSAAKDLAKELIELYSQRMKLKGHAFAPDSPWQSEFEDAFEYEETEDQLRCAIEIKQDMESSVPMDRLLCGDVGFGKTEVALRAVMKCLLDGKQAAILVPTTVLAQQHFVTVVARFAGFPVKIEVLSRFRTPSQMKAAIKGIGAGAVDLIIGTHRLLQRDVRFKDLGLLIVDEEQRFGVSHKERLKEISRHIDVLTLSATPIPRTLNMALSGIRDMSTIEDPPQNRRPVQTYVMEYNLPLIADAIRRETARGGQVYYLHNQIRSIDRVAARLASIDESLIVDVAHGQMSEEQLSGVMRQMVDGSIQVLVCTTIIETGIDIPNVNTLIIEDADKLGLAQLHQIRGRVGRSARHAFAYLTYKQGRVLTELAEKRLTAIREFAEFGSGFKIAMRDLEIRGAGNVLGSEQSGHMMSVGYDMYLKLLEEAVLEERGEMSRPSTECSADLVVSANIPDRYIASSEQRMDIYRRIAAIRSKEDAEDMFDELIDRFGDMPKSVTALISIALLRAGAAGAGITDISQKSGNLVLTLGFTDFMSVSQISADPFFKGRVLFSAGEKPYITLRLKSGDDPLALAQKFVDAYYYYSEEAALKGGE